MTIGLFCQKLSSKRTNGRIDSRVYSLFEFLGTQKDIAEDEYTIMCTEKQRLHLKLSSNNNHKCPRAIFMSLLPVTIFK